MDFEQERSSADPVAQAAELRALVPAGESVAGAVTEIIDAVRTGGDGALVALTERFDCHGASLATLRVDPQTLSLAVRQLAPELHYGLEMASENVAAVAHGWRAEAERTVALAHHQVRLRRAPVDRAAVYVPGGRASYPSTVIMGVVTARAAGVAHVTVCAPPSTDGEIDAVVLAACALTGADQVLRVGGAQAIAALAYGTESVDPVDVIVGPGNLYVQEAKRQVSGRVGIDGFAGPSDLVVILSERADPDVIALDLLAQAEHGPGTLVIGISDRAAVLAELGRRLVEGPPSAAVIRLVEVRDMELALALAQALAPEHLELVGEGAEALAPRATRAGCVFVGAAAATAFGDYIAGSNHILPTGGAARFASGLSPAHFLRSFSEVRVADPEPLARAAAPLARAEGFELHARSMEARIRDNDRDVTTR
ncbi:MAG: histidinol dehydrogenase [Actinomycetota bacterium]|nr:histidinol dehydrogenase [Actinomycetota bacterium]